jgi:HEAT repeat protein
MTLQAPMAGEGLRTLVRSLGNPGSRTAATEALLAAGPEGRAALRAGLAHPDPAVRRFAARALDHVALEDETVEALVALIHAERIPKVRSAAVHVLACEGCKPKGCSLSADVVGVLIDVLLNDPSADVRRQTLEGLRVAPPQERVMAALHAALADRSQKIRVKTGWALRSQQELAARERALAGCGKACSGTTRTSDRNVSAPMRTGHEQGGGR